MQYEKGDLSLRLRAPSLSGWCPALATRLSSIWFVGPWRRVVCARHAGWLSSARFIMTLRTLFAIRPSLFSSAWFKSAPTVPIFLLRMQSGFKVSKCRTRARKRAALEKTAEDRLKVADLRVELLKMGVSARDLQAKNRKKEFASMLKKMRAERDLPLQRRIHTRPSLVASGRGTSRSRSSSRSGDSSGETSLAAKEKMRRRRTCRRNHKTNKQQLLVEILIYHTLKKKKEVCLVGIIVGRTVVFSFRWSLIKLLSKTMRSTQINQCNHTTTHLPVGYLQIIDPGSSGHTLIYSHRRFRIALRLHWSLHLGLL